MFEHPPRTSPLRAWLAVGLVVLAIYVCVPFARSIQRPIRERWGGGAFTGITGAAGLVALALCAREVHRMRRRATAGNFVWLGVAFLGAGLWVKSLHARQPEEALHFVEYSVLSIFLFRAWATQVRHPILYVGTVLTAALIGLGDELVQWVSPERYFDLRDVSLNAGAAALTQLAIARGFWPTYLGDRPGRRAVRIVHGLGLTLLVLLTACLLNTPRAQAAYSERLPLLGWWFRHAHAMTEYGYLYWDEGIGQFKSRLSPVELARANREQGDAAARKLAAPQSPAEYQAFLDEHPPVSHPYEYEACMRLFRRDQYFNSASKYADANPEEYRRHLTVAYRENQILESYFSGVLSGSARRLDSARVRHLEEHLESTPYVSPVGQTLLVRFRPWQAVAAALGLACGWILVFRWWGKSLPCEAAAR